MTNRRHQQCRKCGEEYDAFPKDHGLCSMHRPAVKCPQCGKRFVTSVPREETFYRPFPDNEEDSCPLHGIRAALGIEADPKPWPSPKRGTRLPWVQVYNGGLPGTKQ
ncbi:DNA-directed RNA polymerase subunit RPC12/RpoP [Rhodococcus percolatus]|nr:DNA-directed RNA polymerase subunit RPC12/RpoP [Rhodococcus opacus]MBP2205209.1 DNA-directed RNA polymerase subunit RPC12/RpoP [Rhodococcus opacus]